MQGLDEMSGGVAGTVTISGVEYAFNRLRAADWSEAARHLESKRKSPIETVKSRLDGLSEPAQKYLLMLAYQDERDGELLSIHEVERWFKTPEGKVYQFWLSLRRSHPEINLEHAERLLEMFALDRVKQAAAAKLAEKTKGLPLGNSEGQAQVDATDSTDSTADSTN